MDLTVKKPERKKDYYLCRMLTRNGKTLVITLKDTQWMRLFTTKDGNTLLRLYVSPNSDADMTIRAFDNTVFQTTREKNQQWFNTHLSDEQLHTFFHPSIDPLHPSITLICRQWVQPLFYFNGVLVESIKGVAIPKDASVRVEIEPQGIVFQKTRFGIRWVLRKCWITVASSATETAVIDRGSIEQQWRDDIAVVQQGVEREIQKHDAKIRSLQEYAQSLTAALEKAKHCENDAEWNMHLENLSKLFAKGCHAFTD